MTRLPWVTIAFVVCGAVVGFVDGAPEALEYRHAEVAAGEIWRPLTGQLAHWSARMAVADLGAIAVIGALLEQRSRRMVVLAMVAGLAMAGWGVHLLPPMIARYRGSSTIASALYVALALDLWRRGPSTAVRSGAVMALGMFLIKTAIEAATGRALFAGSMAPGVEVLPRAHLLGGAAGVVAWGLRGAPRAPGRARMGPPAA